MLLDRGGLPEKPWRTDCVETVSRCARETCAMTNRETSMKLDGVTMSLQSEAQLLTPFYDLILEKQKSEILGHARGLGHLGAEVKWQFVKAIETQLLVPAICTFVVRAQKYTFEQAGTFIVEALNTHPQLEAIRRTS
jgi:hypothetical protein